MSRLRAFSLLLFLLAFVTPAAAAPSMPAAIGAEDRQAIVDQILRALDDAYVFPEIARKMGERLRLRLGSGAYDRLATLPEFAGQLTADLQGVSHDLHLEVTWTPAEPQAAGQGPPPEELQARMAAGQRRENYWFRDVKLLPGNVGYLKLDGFAPADLAGSTAAAAMGFLAGSDALIFDLRENDGGSASMVQLLASYLLPGKPTHFSSFYVRKGDRTDQLWTQAWVPGTRLAETPVYVLTSHLTFSAAEDFAYSLKSLKRATIVGETTRGGAHPVETVQIKGYPLAIRLPFGRSVNPVTGTDWEGTGVTPDVAVPAAEALTVAHAQALAAIAEKATDPQVKATAALLHQVLEGRRHPVTLPAKDLTAFAGSYGPVHVTLEDGVLHYQLGSGPKMRLLPIGNDKFLGEDSNDLLIRFERDASGRVVRVVGVTRDGEIPIDRDTQ